jgi:hypothetical protein
MTHAKSLTRLAKLQATKLLLQLLIIMNTSRHFTRLTQSMVKLNMRKLRTGTSMVKLNTGTSMVNLKNLTMRLVLWQFSSWVELLL